MIKYCIKLFILLWFSSTDHLIISTIKLSIHVTIKREKKERKLNYIYFLLLPIGLVFVFGESRRRWNSLATLFSVRFVLSPGRFVFRMFYVFTATSSFLSSNFWWKIAKLEKFDEKLKWSNRECNFVSRKMFKFWIILEVSLQLSFCSHSFAG